MVHRTFCLLWLASSGALSVLAEEYQGKGKGKGGGGKGWGGMMAMGMSKGMGYGSMSNMKGSKKGMGMKSMMGKGKGGYVPYDDDFYYDACAPVVDALWTYARDESEFFSDIGGDGLIDVGDSYIFEDGVILASIDTTVVASGTFSGTCTATTSLTTEREYCVLTYDFAELGTVAVQGPLEAMTIVGSTGCFLYFSGEVNGFLDDPVYSFAVNAWARR